MEEPLSRRQKVDIAAHVALFLITLVWTAALMIGLPVAILYGADSGGRSWLVIWAPVALAIWDLGRLGLARTIND